MLTAVAEDSLKVSGSFRRRQLDLNACSAAKFTLNLYLSAVRIADGFADCQAESGSSGGSSARAVAAIEAVNIYRVPRPFLKGGCDVFGKAVLILYYEKTHTSSYCNKLNLC
jgi:hypothetical protein